MPRYLGVSKAILEYVVFCHQDDSLWPLSDPKTLKERFDEIFEALKYSKAVDNLKVLRKKYQAEVIILKEREVSAKKDKTMADEVCGADDHAAKLC